MAGMLSRVLEVVVASIFAGTLLPLGLYYIVSATVTGLPPVVGIFFTVVLPILIITGLALEFMPKEIKSKIGL
jgi:hypothetical protein